VCIVWTGLHWPVTPASTDNFFLFQRILLLAFASVDLVVTSTSNIKNLQWTNTKALQSLDNSMGKWGRCYVPENESENRYVL